jgi:hypothetical protein
MEAPEWHNPDSVPRTRLGEEHLEVDHIRGEHLLKGFLFEARARSA